MRPVGYYRLTMLQKMMKKRHAQFTPLVIHLFVLLTEVSEAKQLPPAPTYLLLAWLLQVGTSGSCLFLCPYKLMRKTNKLCFINKPES